MDAPWDTSCPDWEQRILDGRSLVPTLPLFAEEAARAVRVFNRLRLPDVIGNPTLGDAMGDWFRDFVAALFGSYDVAANKRWIQEGFLLVPKKNAKSTGGAGIMLTAAIVNRRPKAELIMIAPTKEIADISFNQAEGMILLDEKLKALFYRQRHIRTITHRRSGAKMQIKAADTDAITGGKAAFTLVDETHVFAARPRAAEVFVELRGALAARPDGFLLQISTQSKSRPAGVFARELRRARQVRDGQTKLPLLPVIYEMPKAYVKEQRWRDPATFALVNPNMNRSVNMDFLVREMEQAERDGADAVALFASQHLNVEIGIGLGSDRWVGADFWEDAGDPSLTFEKIVERSEVVCVGIDGGGLDDLLGLAVLGREKGSRRWLQWAHAWAHQSVLDRRKSEAPRLLDLKEAGDLDIVEDMEQAFAEAADLVAVINMAGKLAMVGLDPMGVGAVVDALAERRIEGNDRVLGVSQGWTLNGAIKTAEVKLSSGALVHCGQALMAWAVGNAKTVPVGNAVTINKQVSGTAKIDPLMATFDAVALMSRNPPALGASVYEERGLLVI